MPLPATWLIRWMRIQAYVAPVAILLALWLPGCNQGWLRVDSHKYTALAHFCWSDAPPAHDFWAPQLGDQPYFNKPPLAFWIVGALLRATGPEVWAVRLASLIAAVATVLLTVDLARRLSGRRVALLTGIVVATTIEFFRYTRAFSLDLWLTLFIIATVWCVVVAATTQRTRWALLAALPIAAALMVKPFIVVFPVALLITWVACIGRARLIPAIIGATIAGAALAAPWHIAMIDRFGEAFTSTYFGSQTVDRLEGTFHEANPWWYYLRAVPATYLPWIATLALGALAIVRRRFTPRDRALIILSAIWIIGWMTITSLFGDRRLRYIIPIYPLMAPISALWIARCLPSTLRRSGRRAALWVAPGALVIAGIVALLPIRIHADAEARWPALIAELDRLGAWNTTWCAPGPYTNASNTYLRRGVWLPLAGPDDLGFGIAPPIGSLVLITEKESGGIYADLGPVVWSKGDLRLVRLEKSWPQ